MDDEDLILAGYGDESGYDDEDLEGEDEAGFRLPIPLPGRRAPARRGMPARRGTPASAIANIRRARAAALMAVQPDTGGAALDQIMPFTVGTFTAAVPTLNLTGTPQRKFQLTRLVIELGRVGASATGLVVVTALTVGADPQFVQQGSIPASMFASNAVGIKLRPNAARPGITVTLSLALLGALAGADTIIVAAGGTGPALA